MLLDPQQGGSLQQGDIIADVPFIVFGKTINVKAEGDAQQKRLEARDPASFDQLKDKKLTASGVPMVLQPGLVLTQGCDIDHKDFITLARIFPFDVVSAEAEAAINHDERLALHDMMRRMTEGYNYPNYVYLGPLDGLGRCVADLLKVQSYPQAWKSCFQKKRWKSLSGEGLKYLQGRLNLFSGRFALDDGFWHMGDDADIHKQAQDHDAVEQSWRRLDSKKKGNG